ncbi:MAG: hypothetical protein Q8R04_00045, partial [Nanoarchaeota archaeon]|nr:hypothetical protein [Nanoarchaeota archaeon]
GNVELQKNNEVFLNIRNTEASGRQYALVSAGSSGGIGIGKFSVYDKTADASRLTIDSSGNVGIGTASPSQKLDVTGYVKGQSGLCIGSDCRTNWPSSGITSESDTLQSVTDRGSSTSRSITVGGLCIGGDCRTGWPGVGGLDVSGPIRQTACGAGQTKIYDNLCMDSDFRGPSLTKDALWDCIQRGGHVARLDEYYAACKAKGTSFTPPPFLTGDQSYVHVDVWPAYTHTESYGISDQCTFKAATAQSYLDPDSGHAGTWKYKCSY